MIFVGDDWAEDHHDVYLMDEAGKRLAARRLPEGLAGISQLHELFAGHGHEFLVHIVVGDKLPVRSVHGNSQSRLGVLPSKS